MNFFQSALSYIRAHMSTELMIYIAIAILLLILPSLEVVHYN